MRGLIVVLAGLIAGCASVDDTRPDPVEAAPTVSFDDLDDWDISDRLRSPQSMDSLLDLAASNPNSAITQRRILQAAAQAGDATRAMEALSNMHALGLRLSDGGYAGLRRMFGELSSPVPDLAPVAESKLRAVIPADIRLAENVAIDERTGRLFAGSIVERAVYVSDDGAAWRKIDIQSKDRLTGLAVSGVGSVGGLAIDATRRNLWLTSERLDETPDGVTAFVGLVEIDLDTLEEKRRITAPSGARALADLTVTEDGTVIASDPLSGVVYRLAPGRGQMEPLVAGYLASPQGIAIHPSQRYAYIADWAYGIAVVNLETREVKRLSAPADVALDGTDGLAWHDGSLIAVQNGLVPMRIVRLALGADGLRVTGMGVLERGHPDWGEPTVGQVVGDSFVYVSNPQWNRFGEGGTLNVEGPLSPNPVRVLELPARAGE